MQSTLVKYIFIHTYYIHTLYSLLYFHFLEEPKGLVVNCSAVFDNSTILVECGLNDTSSAPALSISISMTGIVKNKMINFDRDKIPVHDRSLPRVVDVPLRFIMPDEYTLMINATNQIGAVTVYNNTFYVPGKIVYTCMCVCVCLSLSLYLCL